MPRRGKGSKVPVDQPGAPNRAPVIDAPGQPYGERKAMVDAQRQAPPGPNPQTQAPPGPVAQGGLDQAFQALDQGGLGSPVGMLEPGEGPITAGLSRGPGPGPESLMQTRRKNTVSRQLQMMAAVLDDPSLVALANRASERGL